jgi:hypothetical protein
MAITLNGTTGVVTPGATVGAITGILKATSGVVAQAVAGSDYGQLTLATAQSATGTAVDFTSIPSWAKRITIIFQGVSTNGSASVIVRLGTSSGFVASGYLGSTEVANFTTGLPVDGISNAAAVRHGCVQIINVSSNSWVSAGSMGRSDSVGSYTSGGSVSLASTLTQVQITTGNGTDTFDAGTINISYE